MNILSIRMPFGFMLVFVAVLLTARHIDAAQSGGDAEAVYLYTKVVERDVMSTGPPHPACSNCLCDEYYDEVDPPPVYSTDLSVTAMSKLTTPGHPAPPGQDPICSPTELKITATVSGANPRVLKAGDKITVVGAGTLLNDYTLPNLTGNPTPTEILERRWNAARDGLGGGVGYSHYHFVEVSRTVTTPFDGLEPEQADGIPQAERGFLGLAGDTVEVTVELEFKQYSGSSAPWVEVSFGSGVFDQRDTSATFNWCNGPSAPVNQSLGDLGGCDCRCGPGSADGTCPVGAGNGTSEQSAFSSSSGGSNCGSCSGGGGGEGGDGASSLSLSSRMVPNRTDEPGSYGPGAFSNYDFHLYGNRAGSGDPSEWCLSVFDPQIASTDSFKNVPDQDLFVGCPSKCYLDFSVGGAGEEDSDLRGKMTTLERKDGYKFDYEFKDPGNFGSTGSSVPNAVRGRLTKITDPDGFETTITYVDTPGNAASQFEIASISDPYGVVATPTYGTHGNQRVWTSVSIAGYKGSGNVVIDYVYDPDTVLGGATDLNDGKLIEVKRDGVAMVAYDRQTGLGPGRSVIEFTNHQDPGSSGKIYVTEDYMPWGANDVANQYAGVTTKREDGAGNPVMELTPDPATTGLFYIQSRGQLMEWVPGQSLRYIQNWSGDSSSGYTFDENAQETIFACNPDSSPVQAALGQHLITIDETGYRTDHEYDGRGNLVKTIYRDDGNDVIGKDDPYTPLVNGNHTYELWVYDDNNDLVYYRDRGGFVTLTQRDDAGRVLRVIRGLRDDSENATSGVPDTLQAQSFGPAEDGTGLIQEITIWNAAGLMEYTTTEPFANSDLPSGAPDSVADWTSATWPGLPIGANSGRWTFYDYDANNRVQTVHSPKPIGSPGSSRPTVSYVWEGARLKSMTNERDHLVEYHYDSLGRRDETRYFSGPNASASSTAEQTVYVHNGPTDPGPDGMIVYTKDRNDIVSRQEQDAAGRRTKTTQAYGRASSLLAEPLNITEATTGQQVTTYSYDSTTTRLIATRNNGALTETEYDYRGRVVKTTAYPRVNVKRVTERVYKNNLLFSQIDRFGSYVPANGGVPDYFTNQYFHQQFMAYANDRQMVRTIKTRDVLVAAGLAGKTNQLLLDEDRQDPTTANPGFVIADAVRDVRGNVVDLVDGYDTITRTTYDALGRSVMQVVGANLATKLTSISSYDDWGRMLYSINAAGVPTQYTYDDADNVQTQTVGGGTVGTSLGLVTSYEYDSDGSQVKVTAPGDANTGLGVTEINRVDCCGRSVGTKTAEGDGRIVNQDHGGRTVHTAVVENYDQHTDLLNPVDLGTVSESTTRYYDNGRVQFRTVWKEALGGSVDVTSPPIAGVTNNNGEIGQGGVVDLSKGVTTQYVYDDNLVDIAGLNVAAGQAIDRLHSDNGPSEINIQEALARLEASLGNTAIPGGAGVKFDADSPGSATVVIAPDEKTMRVSIADGMGRTVMTALMRGPATTENGVEQGPNTLIDWNCTLHDKFEVLDLGEKTVRVDADGEQTYSVVNGMGLTFVQIDQLDKKTKTLYDSGGNPLEIIDPLGQKVAYTYDLLGRQRTMTDNLNHLTQTTYNAKGQIDTRIDAKNKTSLYYYDTLGRLLAEIDRAAKLKTFRVYDAAGRLHQLVDGENKVTTYLYNKLGQRTNVRLADYATNGNKDRRFEYDAAGRMVKAIRPSGKTTVTTYELSGVVGKREHFPAHNSNDVPTGLPEVEDLTYNEYLQLVGTQAAPYGSFERTLTYTDRGQIKTDKTSLYKSYGAEEYEVAYEYDDRGRLATLTYPSGRRAAYTYDPRSMVDKIYWAEADANDPPADPAVPANEIEDRGYNELGLLETVNRPGTNETRMYDQVNRLKSIDNSNVSFVSYEYDNNHNKLEETWAAPMDDWNFQTSVSGGPTGYDAEDRIIKFVRPGADGEKTFNRDKVGNINYIGHSGATFRQYSDTHELTDIGGTTQVFDLDGNLTSNSIGTIDWDFSGRLKSVNTTAGLHGAYYGATGQRVFSYSPGKNSFFIYAGPNVIAEYTVGEDADEPTREFVYAGTEIDALVLMDKRVGATTNKYHVTRNQQNSVTALVNVNGTIAERYAYDVFGKRHVLDAAANDTNNAVSLIGNPYGYTSRRHDPSGLMYFRARYYDPTTGEFTSQDPLEYVDGMSLYRGYFVPNAVDPSGTLLEDPGKSTPIPPSDLWRVLCKRHGYKTYTPWWTEYTKEYKKFRLGCVGVASCMIGHDAFSILRNGNCYTTLQEAIDRQKEMKRSKDCKCPSTPEIIGHTWRGGDAPVVCKKCGLVNCYEGGGKSPGGDRWDFGFYECGKFYHAEDTFHNPKNRALCSDPAAFHNYHNTQGWQTVYCVACSGTDPTSPIPAK